MIATKVFPVVPTAAVVQQRGVASAQRLGVRTIDLYQVHWPNPVVRDGTAMRGMRALRDVGVVDQVGVSNYPLRRWQRVGGRPRRGRAEQPGAVQPGLPRPDGGDAAVGRRGPGTSSSPTARSPRGCCRGATTPTTGRRTGCAPRTRCSCRRTCAPRGPLLVGAARGRRRRTTRRRRRSRWPGRCTTRTSSRSRARRAWRRWRATPRRRRSRWRADEYGALTAAAEAFHPSTGVSAIPALVRARRS